MTATAMKSHCPVSAKRTMSGARDATVKRLHSDGSGPSTACIAAVDPASTTARNIWCGIESGVKKMKGVAPHAAPAMRIHDRAR